MKQQLSSIRQRLLGSLVRVLIPKIYVTLVEGEKESLSHSLALSILSAAANWLQFQFPPRDKSRCDRQVLNKGITSRAAQAYFYHISRFTNRAIFSHLNKTVLNSLLKLTQL